VINDVSLKDYAALVISEPHVFEMNGKVTTSPMGHQGCMAIFPGRDTMEDRRCEACFGCAEIDKFAFQLNSPAGPFDLTGLEKFTVLGQLVPNDDKLVLGGLKSVSCARRIASLATARLGGRESVDC
jgi:hypothetical protein